jgi:hypothetical protein
VFFTGAFLSNLCACVVNIVERIYLKYREHTGGTEWKFKSVYENQHEMVLHKQRGTGE